MCFFIFLMLRPPSRSTLFPYTTHFRSWTAIFDALPKPVQTAMAKVATAINTGLGGVQTAINFVIDGINTMIRSEEHTSELQSPVHLVCCLLLEKKKNTATPRIQDHNTL